MPSETWRPAGRVPISPLGRRSGALSRRLGEECERTFGAPYYHFHRADLLEALAAALPAQVVRMGYRCVGIEAEANGPLVRFENDGVERGDVIIGADGIHSSVRRISW